MRQLRVGVPAIEGGCISLFRLIPGGPACGRKCYGPGDPGRASGAVEFYCRNAKFLPDRCVPTVGGTKRCLGDSRNRFLK